jgi:hypothetical protein
MLLKINYNSSFKQGILCIVEIPSFDIASAIAWFDPSPLYITIVDHGTLCTLRLTMIWVRATAVVVFERMTLHSVDHDL